MDDEELEVTQEDQDVEPRIPDVESHIPSREEMLESAFEEGAEESVIEELVSKEGELTVEDLRKLPGSEDYSDEELMAEWKKVSGATGEAAAEAFKSPVPLYDEKGNKVEDVSKITVQDLLSGKVHFGYNANGKEQRKALEAVLRVAQLGHHNEQRYAGTIAERNQVLKQYQEASEKVTKYEADREVWTAALAALANGNAEPIKQIAQAYAAEVSKIPQVAPAGMIVRNRPRNNRP
jgi:hypothetical protein